MPGPMASKFASSFLCIRSKLCHQISAAHWILPYESQPQSGIFDASFFSEGSDCGNQSVSYTKPH
jgi:hypothetical protein